MNRKVPVFVAMTTVDAIPLLVLDHWGHCPRRYGLIHLVKNGNLPKEGMAVVVRVGLGG